MIDPEPLATELREAERELKTTLEQACSTDLTRADTGELIRVEEMLAIASEAAKKAISIRRRRRQDRPKGKRGPRPEPRAAEHREFTDREGVAWRVWAVHPADREPDMNTRLLGDFQHGWLAFESDVGKRRLRPIPERWDVVDEQGLRGLLDRAQDVPTRRLDDRPG